LLRSRFKKIQDANAGSRFADRIEAQGFLDTGYRITSAVKHEAKQGSHPHMKRDAALSNMPANKRPDARFRLNARCPSGIKVAVLAAVLRRIRCDVLTSRGRS
jgi:hypothetical protein